MTGTHVVEECPELEQRCPRRREWREALVGRARSEEVDVLEIFFHHVDEFLCSLSNPNISFKPVTSLVALSVTSATVTAVTPAIPITSVT